MKKLPNLSKTKFVGGLQCHKLMWYQVNAKDQIPAPSAAKQEAFERGHYVGAEAMRLYPEGREVDWSNYQRGLALTKDYVASRIPIFEAGFTAAGAHARADILNPVEDDAWDIIEVKSVREVKEVFIRDIAFQLYCYTAAGIRVRRSLVMHIRPEVEDVFSTPAGQLFAYEDVTDRVLAYRQEIAEKISRLRTVAGQSVCPAIPMGDHCQKPYACMMIPLCSRQAISV